MGACVIAHDTDGMSVTVVHGCMVYTERGAETAAASHGTSHITTK